MKKYKIIIAIFIIAAILLSGCEKNEQLHERLIVQGVSIDKELDTYKVGVKVFIADELLGSEYSGEENISLLVSEGNSVFDALNKITKQNGKTPLYSQNSAIIVGESVANEGMKDVMDFFVRHYESRPLVKVFVVNGKAIDLMNYKSNGRFVSAMDISELVKFGPQKSYTLSSDVLNFMADVEDDSSDPKTTCLSIVDIDGFKAISTNGTAIFNDDKLSGYLTPEESRGALLIDKNVTGGTEVVNISGLGKVTYYINRSSSKVNVNIENNLPKFNIKIKVDADIYEIDKENNSVDIKNDTFKLLEENLKEKIKQMSTEAINKAIFKYNSDIFHFGRMIMRSNPNYFKKIEGNWKTIMNKCDYNIEVKANIKRSGQEKIII